MNGRGRCRDRLVPGARRTGLPWTRRGVGNEPDSGTRVHCGSARRHPTVVENADDTPLFRRPAPARVSCSPPAGAEPANTGEVPPEVWTLAVLEVAPLKPHLIVRLRRSGSEPDAPHWTEILNDKSRARDRFLPEIDRILADHGIPIWATREYQPAAGSWSPDEIAAGLERVYRLVLQSDSGVPQSMIDEIHLLPIVEEVRLGRVGRVDLPPAVASQMAATTGGAARRAIYLEEAQEYTRGDPAVVVAILDTGIALDHPELTHALLPGRDFVDIIDGASAFLGDYIGADEDPTDEVGHGTHVAGIVAGRGRSMPPGVVPRCRVLPVRVLAAMKRDGKPVGAGLVENINAGIKWAVDRGADVINMSLGVRHTGGGLPHQEVVEYAARRGVTMVAASGNDGTEELYYPGAFESVIAVGAADPEGQVAAFSTWGRQVDFVAPGTEIYSSYLARDYAFSSGTSHAAPFVSGAAAMLKSYGRARKTRIGDRQVKHILKHTSDKVDRRFKHRKAGYGHLNLADAMRLLKAKLN